jgi:hypothetical protein
MPPVFGMKSAPDREFNGLLPSSFNGEANRADL